MAKIGNRTKESTDTTGTGTLDLNGAPVGFRGFGDELSSGDTVYYLIVDDPDNPVSYEYGVGTFTSGTPDTLSRDTVEGSSNSGSKVSFVAGTKTVISTITVDTLDNIPPAASTTVAGKVELATTAETTTGTDATRAVTPDGLHDMTSLAGASWFLDEDDMVSDSETKTASQQSIKAYVTSSIAAAGGITLATMQASTSGTSIDFTSIPAGTKRITIMFAGVSTTGTSDVIVQLGDSGGVETTGYSGNNVDSTQSGGVANNTGFILNNLQGAGDGADGAVTLTLMDAATFLWVMTSTMSDDASTNVFWTSGTKTLSAELDRVRITTVTGSQTFDGGSINIAVE